MFQRNLSILARTLKDEEKRKRKIQSTSLYWDIRAVRQSGFVSSHFELMTRFGGLVSIRLYCSQTAATLLTVLIYHVSNVVFICHGLHHINIDLVTLWCLLQHSVYLLTRLFTPWSRVLLEKLTGSQSRNSPHFMESERKFSPFTPPQSPTPLYEDTS